MQHPMEGRFCHSILKKVVGIKVIVIELVVTGPHTVTAWPLRTFGIRHLVGQAHGQHSSVLLSEVRPPFSPYSSPPRLTYPECGAVKSNGPYIMARYLESWPIPSLEGFACRLLRVASTIRMIII